MVSPAGPGPMSAEEPLTTKEGWRRFADRQTAMPELPGAVVLARMTAREREEHDEAQQAYHADLPLANTPVIQRVVATTRLLIQLNRHQVSARRGVIVSGPSATGKTTALTQLGRTHERHIRNRHPEDDFRLPVIYVTVPPAATARMLAMEFARFLGLQFAGRVNLTDIVDAVCVTAARTRTELVCVDELHNLNLATRAGAEVSDQLKYFAERLPATFTFSELKQSLIFTVQSHFSYSPRTVWCRLVAGVVIAVCPTGGCSGRTAGGGSWRRAGGRWLPWRSRPGWWRDRGPALRVRWLRPR